jgi:signal transduction histidine kinase
MSGSVMAALFFAGAAGALAVLARRAERRRCAAAARARELEARLGARERDEREWFAVFAHELRSPLSAVLGYSELLTDGTFGDMDPRSADAAHRLRRSAEQLMLLIQDLDPPRGGTAPDDASGTGALRIIEDAAAVLAADAESRDVQLDIDARLPDVRLTTRLEHARRALCLALGAAIKASPGCRLALHAEAGEVPVISIAGSRLHPTEMPLPRPPGAPHTPLTGAGIRLELAARAARQAGGSIVLRQTPDGTLLQLHLPHLLIDASEHRP